MRNIIVTGASRGVGLSIARKLAANGDRVIAIARRGSDELKRAQTEIEAIGRGELHFESFDLNDVDDIPAVVRRLYKTFGSLDGLVNNAAIGTVGVLANMPRAQIEALCHLNIVALAIMTKHVTRKMLLQKSGRIVNIASVVAFNGHSGMSVYAATKAATIGFTRSLARELGSLGITVNAVAPGFMETEMTKGLDEEGRRKVVRRSALRRLVDPDDIGNAVAFLLSEQARNITGTVVTVDAGNFA